MTKTGITRHTKRTILKQLLACAVLAPILAVATPALADSHEDKAVSQAQEAKNKEVALNFFKMIFDEHKVAEAFEKYSVPDYIQHNPMAKTGAQPASDFLQPFLDNNPEYSADIKRVITEGNLVVIHSHVKATPDDRGRAVVDIFRVEDGRVVEHWDVVQAVPEKSRNDNTMF